MNPNIIGPIPKQVQYPVYPTPWRFEEGRVYDATMSYLFDAEDEDLAELLVTLVNIQAKTGAIQLDS